MQARLDYPHFTCAQCRKNQEEDGVPPDCERCPVPRVSPRIRAAEEVYGHLSRPLVRELGLAQWVMELLIPRGEPGEVLELLDQVCTIDEVVREHAEESG